MTVERDEQLVALQHAGRVVWATIDAMGAALEPGMTTLELDRIGEAFAELHGAVSGPAPAHGLSSGTQHAPVEPCRAYLAAHLTSAPRLS